MTPPMVGKTNSLSRSVLLFRAFLKEQSAPDHFYETLPHHSARQISEYVPLYGRAAVDAAVGPGSSADPLRAAGTVYLGVDPDVGELSARGELPARMVRASGTELPIRTDGVDICYSSNVLEHVADPVRMLDEMVRVTRPGGTV